MTPEVKKSFQEFLKLGILGTIYPFMNLEKVWEMFESVDEDIYLGNAGNQGIRYGRLFVAGEPGVKFENNLVDRVGVDFWTNERTKLLKEIPWYMEIGKMRRHEIYDLLREENISFLERVKHISGETSYSDEICIGQIPMTILAFHTEQEIPYHITWFKNGLDETDYPYTLQLREPKE